PDFVHGYKIAHSKEGPAGGRISLETPVVYFYSDRPLTASLHVEFPKGTLTEWFPHAARSDNKLDWHEFELITGETAKLLNETKKSRYYAARETDASPLRVTYLKEGSTTTEQEKFLFYRGVGDFDMPLVVKAQGDGKFLVEW